MLERIGVRAREARVVALDDPTGRPSASSSPVELGDSPSIAVWQGFVAVLSTRGIAVQARRGGRFAPSKKPIAGSFPFPPSIQAGYLSAAREGGGVVCVELQKATAELDRELLEFLRTKS